MDHEPTHPQDGDAISHLCPEESPLKKPRLKGCNCESLPEDESKGCNCGLFSEDIVGGDDDDSEPDDDVYDEAQLKQYEKQVEESGGFDVDSYPGMFMRYQIVPFMDYKDPESHTDPEMHNDFKLYSITAIEDFNEKNDACYEFFEVEKVNTSMLTYYITFKAKDLEDLDYPDVEPKTFQAKVYQHPGRGRIDVELCRLKKNP